MGKMKASEAPDVDRIDYTKGYRLGTRVILPLGEVFQYGKIDFGIVGKDNGKAFRNIQYKWFPKNVLAAQRQVGFIY